ncbi:hypothetical protein [Microvirus sp.]|nr:hypothetical protein [Microvirus sp.]UYL88455.1 hypothetical protein [Microvirus sp.]UYL88481.1 hypothetical protein [Microvirus sp.]
MLIRLSLFVRSMNFSTSLRLLVRTLPEARTRPSSSLLFSFAVPSGKPLMFPLVSGFFLFPLLPQGHGGKCRRLLALVCFVV